MPRPQTSLILLAAAVACAAAPEARAQEPVPAAPTTAADSGAVYRREVFAYDRRGRPDPFRPLLTMGDLGIRLADLQLRGIVYNTNRRASVAVFSHADTAQSLRMREGSRYGNITVLRIQPRRVDVRVDEFGSSRVESIPLSRPTPGVYTGSGAPAGTTGTAATDAAPAQQPAGAQAEPAPRRPQPLQRVQARNRQQAREKAQREQAAPTQPQRQ